MRRIVLILLLAFGTFAAVQSRTQVRLMSQAELMESAQVLGKIVFEDHKIKIYDTQDQLIAEPEYTENLTIEVNTEESTVTISNGEGESETIDIEMGLDEANASLRLSSDGNTLTIQGANAGDMIRLYSMTGVLLKQQSASGESTDVSIQDLPVGTYILIVKNNFLKILKQ